ncbi:MAG: EpsG family protein [Paludibacterium sp.]|uniref:EpsG family protein n=1 Tax=Paludibacterium sp. TaxID=1917523 RepID=UPI0025FBFAEA|nr:EpsG family protein [Paludibacterium sp.]MBV8045719.1 EpsG family protein [Paludibacterium sp.]MBV8467915.1 EpsG family protein [Burkholderiales bacterium]
MTPYFLVFGWFLAICLVLETTGSHRSLTRTERWLLLLPLAVFSIMYAGRIGTDVESYRELFDQAEQFPLEPGFSMLMIAAKWLGLNYTSFTRVLAAVQILLLGSVVMRLRDPLFFLLFYFSSFFLNFQFNAIRNSLALLVVAAMYVRLLQPRFSTLLASTVIHYSSLITLGLQRLALSRRQWLVIALVIVASCGVSLIWLQPDLLGPQFSELFVYRGYLDQEYESKTVYPALLLKLAVVWLLYRNGGNRFYMAAYAVLVILIHAISPVLSRLSDLVLFLTALDFCLRHRLERRRLLAIGLTLTLVASSLLIPWSDCQEGGGENWCLSGPGSR